ncbi:MAG: hypothetical protein J6X28_01510 [Bacilli bacterium]|nr:hypothetical protein [Bacilli bacterium]
MAEISTIKKQFIHYIDAVLANHKVSHAYLIEVDNYEDDLQYVYFFIKMILCNCSYEELSTSDHPILQQIDSGNYPDIQVISSDTSVINKGLITDLQKEFNNKSLLGNKRIYIIKEAEKLNGYSANTILKFLEEPEDDIIAFLLTDNRYHLLETILSRCQVLSLKEKGDFIELDDSFMDFLECVVHPKSFFIQYNSYMKDAFIDKSVIKEHLLLIENVLLSYLENTENVSDEIAILLKDMNSDEIIRYLSILEEEIPKLDFNVNLKLWIDSLFAKLIGG